MQPEPDESAVQTSWKYGAAVLLIAAALGASLYLLLRPEPGTPAYYANRFGFSCGLQTTPIPKQSPLWHWRSSAERSGTVTCLGLFPVLAWARFADSDEARAAVRKTRGPKSLLLCLAGRDAMGMGVYKEDVTDQQDFSEMCDGMEGKLSTPSRPTR